MKLALCIPTGGNPKWKFTQNLVQHACTAARVLGWEDINVFMREGLLPMTREACLLDALHWGAERILWLDDDMTTEPNPDFGNLAPLAGLMQVMDEQEKCGFVGAIYRKQMPPILTTNVWHPKQPEESIKWRLTAPVVRDIPSRPFKCASVGAGYSLMRMSAAKEIIEKLEPPLWRMPVMRLVEGGPATYMTDDSYLCMMLNACGWEVWADPRPITTHLKDAGPLVYNYRQWEESPTDLRPFTKENSAAFRDLDTGCVALDIYTPKETRSQPGYEFMEMTLGKR